MWACFRFSAVVHDIPDKQRGVKSVVSGRHGCLVHSLESTNTDWTPHWLAAAALATWPNVYLLLHQEPSGQVP